MPVHLSTRYLLVLCVGAACTPNVTEESFAEDLAPYVCEVIEECYLAEFEVKHGNKTNCAENLAEDIDDGMRTAIMLECPFDEDEAQYCINEFAVVSCGDQYISGVPACCNIYGDCFEFCGMFEGSI